MIRIVFTKDTYLHGYSHVLRVPLDVALLPLSCRHRNPRPCLFDLNESRGGNERDGGGKGGGQLKRRDTSQRPF